MTTSQKGYFPELIIQLRALSRLIYVVTEEEDLFFKKFRNLVKKYSANSHVFDMSFGLVPLETFVKDWKDKRISNPNTMGIHEALEEIYKQDPKDGQNFYIITDPEIHLSDPMVCRRLLNLIYQIRNDDQNVKLVIFVSSRKFIPPKLARYIHVIEDKGLSAADILATLDRPCGALKIEIPANYAELFRGLTSYEIEAAVSYSIVTTLGTPWKNQSVIYPENIHEFRRQQIKKTGLIEYVDTSQVTLEHLGGTERFKEWVIRTQAAFTEKGRNFGIKIPKGVLLVGIWGTGKSLAAKVLGSQWGLPVVLLEIGKLRSSGLGDTEHNIYQVLKMVEAVSPCILWIDEADKSLSGGQASSVTDSGTTARTLGIFSTWIQETQLPISLVLTANSLTSFPVEFINRMTERFFFDIPSITERVEILKIHLKKINRDPEEYDLYKLAEASKKMVGREIEQAIEAALVDSFHAGLDQLDQDILERVLRRKPRMYNTMVDEVKELVDWVGWDVDADDGIKAKFASIPSRKDNKFIEGAFEIFDGDAAPATNA
jgi:AAA+ superfamily predicted ATPase